MPTLTFATTVSVLLANEKSKTFLFDPKLPGAFQSYDTVLLSARQPWTTPPTAAKKGPVFVAVADFGYPITGPIKLPHASFNITLQSLGVAWTGEVTVDLHLQYQAS